MNITVTHTVYRDDDETQIEIEATATFYHGELDEWSYTSSQPVELTQGECDDIVQKLVDAKADDWDEDKFKTERESK